MLYSPPHNPVPHRKGREEDTAELPEELLAAVFGLLGSGDRKRFSLVSRRWLAAEAASRLRLALDARDPLLPAAPGILRRFSAVSKLALKCDRRADSVGDPALVLVARRLGPGLRRLKLRSLRAVTDDGVHALAAAGVNLRKLSVGSRAFGARGIEAALRSCTQLDELSVKRLRGLASSDPITVPGPRLQSLSMKELYNGQHFCCVTLVQFRDYQPPGLHHRMDIKPGTSAGLQGSYPVRAPLQETKAPSIAASPFQASVSKEATVPPQLNQTKGSNLQLMKRSSPPPCQT
ncbi:hypothetical protein QYE76_027532 [Lolium multiflorum]|uniref:F-box domain-containing protein n=1 Tax=Lolium multiflorum TaxID=4521 RepID=A0AAD8VF10_LOLMU|nr:hypothetical protein QYE76_027532 [Lolium multiflorum]